MIKIDKVNKYFNKGKSNQIHVINDTSMKLPKHGIVCLLGPSGCGKTTLLNAIGGLDKVNSGDIYVDDMKITRRTSSNIDNIRNAKIGYIFQNFNLIDDKTVFDNVAMALKMIGIKDKTVIQKRVNYCLDAVGIYQYRNKLAGALSGGQRQRVAIARAIVKNPKIIIADEPTGNLDSANTLEIMNIIKTISKERLIILVTHERNIADFYSDHIAEMQDGKIVKAYNNDSSRYLDYQLENKIYLKDLPVHRSFESESVKLDVYGQDDSAADVKIVLRGGNLYIDTNGKYNVVDEHTNVELIDDHYSAMDESYFDKHSFEYDKYMPEGHKAKYTSVYGITKLIANGWRNIKSYKNAKKILLIGFLFASMLNFMAISNILGIYDVKPEEYLTTNGHYISISNPDKTSALMNKVREKEGISYVLPGDTKKSITLPMTDYLQTSSAKAPLNVSIAYSKNIKPESLLCGKMPENEKEVLLDKVVIDKFKRNGMGKNIGISEPEDFIGRKIEIKNLKDYTISGVVDRKSPTMYVDESQAMYILTNAADPMSDDGSDYVPEEGGGDNSDPVKSGKVKDLDLADAKITVKKGTKPKEVYDVIINKNHEEEYKIGKTIKTKVGGERLKIVGFYTSDNPIDDTYYVTSSTINRDFIRKQKKFTAYAENPQEMVSELKNDGIRAIANASFDKKAHIKSMRASSRSALIVAITIFLISLIEMFLIQRSSFLSRIKEIGTLRAIGLKKKDIYRMFGGEILVITLMTSIPGIAIMYYALHNITGISLQLKGLYMINPLVALISFALTLSFNLLSGLIPVFNTLRKPPAAILARTDT